MHLKNPLDMDNENLERVIRAKLLEKLETMIDGAYTPDEIALLVNSYQQLIKFS